MNSATRARAERPRGLDASTLAEAFQITAAANADRPAIRTRGDELCWTWREYAERVERVARGLAALGLGRGQTLGLMLTNRPEFHLADSAAIHLGAASFSLYNTCTPAQIEHLLRDAGSAIMVTERAFAETITAVRDRLDSVEHVVVVDGDGCDDTLTLTDLEAGGEASFDFEGAWRAVRPQDILTLIYTSGTTGPPKGVQLTHDNIAFSIGAIEGLIPFPEAGRLISWLPMAHIAERQCSHYLPIMLGFTTTDCPDPREVVAHLPEVRPSWFFAVPRIWRSSGRRSRPGSRASGTSGAGRACARLSTPASRRCAASRRASRFPRSSRRATRRSTSRCCRRSARAWASTGPSRSTSARRRHPPS